MMQLKKVSSKHLVIISHIILVFIFLIYMNFPHFFLFVRHISCSDLKTMTLLHYFFLLRATFARLVGLYFQQNPITAMTLEKTALFLQTWHEKPNKSIFSRGAPEHAIGALLKRALKLPTFIESSP